MKTYPTDHKTRPASIGKRYTFRHRRRQTAKDLQSAGNCHDLPRAGRQDVKALKSAFADADARLPIDKARRQAALTALHHAAACKEVYLVSNRRLIWQNRLRYADRSVILFHLLGCMAMLFLMFLMDLQHVDRGFMTASAMILAGVLGSLSILTVSRVWFSKLAELSESCFFNVRQMAAFDMVFSGLINLAVLAGMILFAGSRWQIRLFQIGLYILVPYTFTQCACLGVLLTEAGRRNVWLIAAIGGFLSVFYVILASTPHLYTESALMIWVIALLLGAGLFGIQIHALFREISKGEILCTN